MPLLWQTPSVGTDIADTRGLIYNINTGSEEMRARDLFYGLWVPDLFMRRVEADDVWSLMCPHECPGLHDCWGDEFEGWYEKYEKEKLYKRQVRAQTLWSLIVVSQIETGNSYMSLMETIDTGTAVIWYREFNLHVLDGGPLGLDLAWTSNPFDVGNLRLVVKIFPNGSDPNGRHAGFVSILVNILQGFPNAVTIHYRIRLYNLDVERKDAEGEALFTPGVTQNAELWAVRFISFDGLRQYQSFAIKVEMMIIPQ